MSNIKEIRLAGICYNTLVNGIGMRRVFFSQGCTHNCKGCFNPETHSFTKGKMFDIDKLVNEVVSDPLLKGVTFSGGDPFQQAPAFLEFAKKLKQHNINIWSYTGYTFKEILQGTEEQKELLKYVDVLVDGEFKIDLKTDCKYRGSSNQNIIDVQKSLKENKIIKYID